MKYAIDETELARLEELAGKIDMLPVDVVTLFAFTLTGWMNAEAPTSPPPATPSPHWSLRSGGCGKK